MYSVNRICGRKIFLVLMMIGLGALGFLTNCEWHGFSSRFSPERLAFINDSKLNYRITGSYDEQCLKRYPQFSSDRGFQSCLISKDLEPTIILIGDSHSQQYYKAVSDTFPRESILNISSSRCLPFTHFKNNTYLTSALNVEAECADVYLSVKSFLKDRKSIKAIYLMGRWDMRFGLGGDANFATMQAKKNLANDINISINKILPIYLVNESSKVVLFEDNPQINYEECIRKITAYRGFESAKSCKGYLASEEVQKLIFDSTNADHNNIYYLDPRAALCVDGICPLIIENKFVNFDSNHLTFYGASRVINFFKHSLMTDI